MRVLTMLESVLGHIVVAMAFVISFTQAKTLRSSHQHGPTTDSVTDARNSIHPPCNC